MTESVESRLERLERLAQAQEMERLAITASAARRRVDEIRLQRERDEAVARIRGAQNLTAAWKPLDKAFLSAKAKLQPRDSKGRWIDMGATVRWLHGTQIGGKKPSGADSRLRSYKQGKVTGFDPKSKLYTIAPDGGGDPVKLEGKNLEVIKAVIPDTPGEAKKPGLFGRNAPTDRAGQKLKVGDAVTRENPSQGGKITSLADSDGKIGFTVHGHDPAKDEQRVDPGDILKNSKDADLIKKSEREQRSSDEDARLLKEAEGWSVRELQNELINRSENHLPDPGFQEILDRKQQDQDPWTASDYDPQVSDPVHLPGKNGGTRMTDMDDDEWPDSQPRSMDEKDDEAFARQARERELSKPPARTADDDWEPDPTPDAPSAPEEDAGPETVRTADLPRHSIIDIEGRPITVDSVYQNEDGTYTIAGFDDTASFDSPDKFKMFRYTRGADDPINVTELGDNDRVAAGYTHASKLQPGDEYVKYWPDSDEVRATLRVKDIRQGENTKWGRTWEAEVENVDTGETETDYFGDGSGAGVKVVKGPNAPKPPAEGTAATVQRGDRIMTPDGPGKVGSIAPGAGKDISALNFLVQLDSGETKGYDFKPDAPIEPAGPEVKADPPKVDVPDELKDTKRGDILRFTENPIPGEDIDPKYDTGLVHEVQDGRAWVTFGDVGGWVDLKDGVSKDGHFDFGDDPEAPRGGSNDVPGSWDESDGEPVTNDMTSGVSDRARDAVMNRSGLSRDEMPPINEMLTETENLRDLVETEDFLSPADMANFHDYLDEVQVADARTPGQWDSIQSFVDDRRDSLNDDQYNAVSDAIAKARQQSLDTPEEGGLKFPENWNHDYGKDGDFRDFVDEPAKDAPAADKPDDATPTANITEFAKNMFQNLHPDSNWDEADQTAWLDAAKKAMEKPND